jgi:hypothetical protein
MRTSRGTFLVPFTTCAATVVRYNHLFRPPTPSARRGRVRPRDNKILQASLRLPCGICFSQDEAGPWEDDRGNPAPRIAHKCPQS